MNVASLELCKEQTGGIMNSFTVDVEGEDVEIYCDRCCIRAAEYAIEGNLLCGPCVPEGFWPTRAEWKSI